MSKDTPMNLYDKEPTRTRVVVTPGNAPVPMFVLGADDTETVNELVDAQGRECDSMGNPLVERPVKPKKAKKKGGKRA